MRERFDDFTSFGTTNGGTGEPAAAAISDNCPTNDSDLNIPYSCLGCGKQHTNLKYCKLEKKECPVHANIPTILTRHIRRSPSGQSLRVPFCADKKQCFMRASSKVVEFLGEVTSGQQTSGQQTSGQ